MTKPLLLTASFSCLMALTPLAQADSVSRSIVSSVVTPLLRRQLQRPNRKALHELSAAAAGFSTLRYLRTGLLETGEHGRWHQALPGALAAGAPDHGLDRAQARDLLSYLHNHPWLGESARRTNRRNDTCLHESLAMWLEAGRRQMPQETMLWAWAIPEGLGVADLFHRALLLGAAPSAKVGGWWVLDGHDEGGRAVVEPQSFASWQKAIIARYGASDGHSLFITPTSRSLATGPDYQDANALMALYHDPLLKAVFNHHNYLSGQGMLP